MEVKLLILVAAIFTPYCLADYVPGPCDNSAIYRPCDLDDYRCIAETLQANSDCIIPDRPFLPRSYEVPEFTFETPYSNGSYFETELIVRNVDCCFISEFYINPETDKAVLGIDCPGFEIESDRTLFQHRSLREDDIYNFHIIAKYPLIRMTLIFQSSTYMDLRRATTFTEVLGGPKFKVIPLDEPSVIFLSGVDYKYLDVYDSESFFYRGYPISRRFVQWFLCDYGLQHLFRL